MIITITISGRAPWTVPTSSRWGECLHLAHGFQLSLIAHADSSLPQTLTLSPGPRTCATTAQIFQSDLTGDGTTGDVLPGTNIGSFGRSVNPGNINNYIDAYNSQVCRPAYPRRASAGLPPVCSPHGQLQQLGAVAPSWPTRLPERWVWGDCSTADLGLTYIAKIHESITLQPSITFYNVTNSQNFDQGNHF